MTVGEKLQAIAQNQQKIYDAGYEKGKATEHDTFWDNFQQKGTRENYQQAFRDGWNDKNFKPKYNMTPTSCAQMFQNSTITNLESALKKAGVTLDTSKSTALLQMIQSSTITHLPKIDMRSSTNNNYAFYSDTLVSIKELVVYGQTVCGAKMFSEGLVDVKITGIIAQDFSFELSPSLSAESVQSIIDALIDYTGSTAKTITFHKDLTITDEQKANINAKNWSLVQI